MKNLMLFTFLMVLMSSCGSLNKNSAGNKPIKLTDESFQATVLESKKISVVYFWASWCGPCKMTGPVIENLAKENIKNTTFGKVNVDKCVDITSKYGIRSIPTVLIIKDGEVVDKYVGGFASSTIKNLIKKHS